MFRMWPWENCCCELYYFNDEAKKLLTDLHNKFDGRISELLTQREQNQENFNAGKAPDFLNETKEIRDSEGHLVLPKGKRVNSDFTVKYYDNMLGTYITKSGTDVRSGISNYVHETRLNDNKRFIFVLKEEYLQQFLNDFRDIMIYGKSSQFVNDTTVQTENLNISMP